ncbi:translational GTPase TypA [Mycoplasma marinum]|uniref:50S ribosomal subunit assembly factor BipA n=1 Tax=Mycoplasma marinum TaxID=1937190 RepID=A0A4R0XMH1_9MOLU|nr:translational GTPase TypA [Mycoplasma marinum]TCG11912.1 translational GTPase TypA [Mycoplasma marinum]
MNKILNVAVIAHVDAGKSTLVDALLEQSGTFNERDERVEQIMDSDDIERERGITIYSKNCSIKYGDTKINVVDTPGHADFSGEVERIIKNVDTVMLLVDSSEGPMPQTRFVLKKSLENGLKPILVINKIDKQDARPAEVVDMVLELFMELNATDEQMEFPILYGAARDGIMKTSMDDDSETLEPLFKTLINHVEEYPHTADENVQMQISSLKYDKYLGRLGLGRLVKGTLTQKGRYSLINSNGDIKTVGFSKIFVNDGLDRKEVSTIQPGDLCIVAGVADITIGDTISSIENPEPMEKIEIEEPTISMNFLVNKSPLNGREGKHVTSSLIEKRLTKELETNVALKVNKIEGIEGFEVQGRGELHLSVLIENMRREGFELAVSKPKVLIKEENGKKLEPYEMAQITCDDEFSGTIIQLMAERKGNLTNMHSHNGQTNMEFIIPTRGLIGIRQSFITKTRGTGILEKTFHEYGPYAGVIEGRKNGVLVSNVKGKTMGYSLWKISERGDLFVGTQTEVYEGMIIGVNSRANDLDVNPIKNKQLTNVRSSGTDESIRVPEPIVLSLEEALEFIEIDELVEVTPESIRLRKKTLDKRFRGKEHKVQ